MIKKLKKNRITQEELDVFHQAVNGTKPLIQEKILLNPQRTAMKPVSHPFSEEIDNIILNLSLNTALPSIRGEELVAYKKDGVPHKTLTHLKKGQYNIEAILDLHGLRLEKASLVLANFLQHCLYDKIRIILIIHGKGNHNEKPLLKNWVNHWLRELDTVLAFCSAASFHGGSGATYVLLKRLKERAD